MILVTFVKWKLLPAHVSVLPCWEAKVHNNKICTNCLQRTKTFVTVCASCYFLNALCQSSAPNSVCGASYVNLTKNQNLCNSKRRSGVGERLRLQFPACHVAIEQRLHFTLIIFFRLQDSEALNVSLSQIRITISPQRLFL